MPSIEMVRRFAGANADSDAETLGLCLNAAIAWYAKAGVADRADDALYDFWVCNLASWFFDNRGAGGDTAKVPPYIVVSVHQLRKRATAGTAPTGGGVGT